MVYSRIFYATTAALGCYCGSSIDKWGKDTFRVKAQVLDPERTPGSLNYQNPHLGSRFAKYGLPQRDVILRYKHFQTSFDQRNRLPNWVVEHLTCNKLYTEADSAYSRRNQTNSLEPRINKEFQAETIDSAEAIMIGTPLADFANYLSYAQGVAESYFRTNTVPQYKQFMTGAWADLNIYCRYLTQRYSDVYVFSGPLFEATEENRMLYRVSQTNRLAFPTHYFKIIVCKTGNAFKFGCFVMPNRRIGPEHTLLEYEVPLAHIEEKVGFKLFKEGVDIPQVILENVADFRENRHLYMPHEPEQMVDAPGLFNIPIEEQLFVDDEGNILYQGEHGYVGGQD